MGGAVVLFFWKLARERSVSFLYRIDKMVKNRKEKRRRVKQMIHTYILVLVDLLRLLVGDCELVYLRGVMVY